jgi:hypothetical protein
MGCRHPFEDIENDLAHQRIAVAVQPAGSNAHQVVPPADFAPVDDLGVVHQPHGKAGQIVFIVLVKPRHFGGFTTDQSAAGLPAAIADAADHRFGHGLHPDRPVAK